MVTDTFKQWQHETNLEELHNEYFIILMHLRVSTVLFNSQLLSSEILRFSVYGS